MGLSSKSTVLLYLGSDQYPLSLSSSGESISGGVLGFYLVSRKSADWKISVNSLILTTPQEVAQYLQPHILLTNASYQPLRLTDSSTLILPVINPKGTYTHFTFRSMVFVNSLIEAMDLFNLDFRDYIYGVPYQIVNDQVVYHRIPGYDLQVPSWCHPIQPEPFTSDIPDQLDSLYTY